MPEQAEIWSWDATDWKNYELYHYGTYQCTYPNGSIELDPLNQDPPVPPAPPPPTPPPIEIPPPPKVRKPIPIRPQV